MELDFWRVNMTDIKGNLESIEHLAQIGQLLYEVDGTEHMATVIEEIHSISQRLTLEYAVKEIGEANDC